MKSFYSLVSIFLIVFGLNACAPPDKPAWTVKYDNNLIGVSSDLYVEWLDNLLVDDKDNIYTFAVEGDFKTYMLKMNKSENSKEVFAFLNRDANGEFDPKYFSKIIFSDPKAEEFLVNIVLVSYERDKVHWMQVSSTGELLSDAVYDLPIQVDLDSIEYNKVQNIVNEVFEGHLIAQNKEQGLKLELGPTGVVRILNGRGLTIFNDDELYNFDSSLFYVDSVDGSWNLFKGVLEEEAEWLFSDDKFVEKHLYDGLDFINWEFYFAKNNYFYTNTFIKDPEDDSMHYSVDVVDTSTGTLVGSYDRAKLENIIGTVGEDAIFVTGEGDCEVQIVCIARQGPNWQRKWFTQLSNRIANTYQQELQRKVRGNKLYLQTESYVKQYPPTDGGDFIQVDHLNGGIYVIDLDNGEVLNSFKTHQLDFLSMKRRPDVPYLQRQSYYDGTFSIFSGYLPDNMETLSNGDLVTMGTMHNEDHVTRFISVYSVEK